MDKQDIVLKTEYDTKAAFLTPYIGRNRNATFFFIPFVMAEW